MNQDWSLESGCPEAEKVSVLRAVLHFQQHKDELLSPNHLRIRQPPNEISQKKKQTLSQRPEFKSSVQSLPSLNLKSSSTSIRGMTIPVLPTSRDVVGTK